MFHQRMFVLGACDFQEGTEGSRSCSICGDPSRTFTSISHQAPGSDFEPSELLTGTPDLRGFGFVPSAASLVIHSPWHPKDPLAPKNQGT